MARLPFVHLNKQNWMWIGGADLHSCRIQFLARTWRTSRRRIRTFDQALALHRKHQRNTAIVRRTRYLQEHAHDYESQHWEHGALEQY